MTAADTTNPTDPSGVTAIAADASKIVLVWNASSDNIGVAGYNIYRGSLKIGTSPYPVYSDTGLSASTSYCYQVEAFDAAGNTSNKTTETCASTLSAADATNPSAPTGLNTTAASASQINLSWTASSDADVVGYAVYRGGTWITSIKGTSYSDTGLSSATEYCYTVKAFDGVPNFSDATLPACATTSSGKPSAPTNVSATAGDGQATISWDSVSGATSYNVYMATQSGVTKDNYSTLTGGMKHSPTNTSYNHTGLTNGTTYYFVVTAVNTPGESVESAQVSAKPTAATVSNYAGTYSGTVTVNSVAKCTFSATVDSTGAMNGTMNCSDGTSTTLSGQVTTSGIVTFTLSGKTDTYSGTINASTGAFSASCTGGCVDSVVFQTTGVGAKFPIATTTTGEFSVSAAFDGTNYLVAMEEASGGTDTQTAQFISQSGTKVGSLISSGRTGGAPVIAFNGTNYLMAWPDDATAIHVLNGAFISTSGVKDNNFQIASGSASIDTYAIGYGGGAYLIAYTYKTANNNNDPHIVYGRTVSPLGAVSSEFTISTGYGDLRQGSTNIAFDGTNFIVIWNEDGSDTEVRGRFVSPAGTPGTEFSINASIYPSDNPMSVSFDGTNYLVVWTDEVSTGEWDVFGQIVTPSGTLSGSAISISTATGHQFYPRIAFDGTNYLVTWTDMRNDANHNWVCNTGEGTCLDVYGQYISTSGTLVGSEFVINNDAGNQWGAVGGFNNGKYFGIANSGSGEFCHNPTTGQVSSDCDVYGVFVTP